MEKQILLTECQTILGSCDSGENLQVIVDNHLHMSSLCKAAANVASFP